MNIDSDTKLYCLIGNPISKSLSPMIHNLIFQLNSMNAKYLAFNIDNAEYLEKAVDGIRALGIGGFNITIPYKIEIMKYIDEIDEKAKILGAINTVLNIDGKLRGFNTDGDGFVKSLRDREIDIKDKKVALIGAGGAAHSIAVSLAFEGIKELVIINRTTQNAYKLKKLVEDVFPNIHINCYEIGRETSIPKDIDILINTTPIGMYPDVDSVPISPRLFSTSTIFYDIIYKPQKTKWILEAEKLGCKTFGGLDMLINQAIYSQKIWNKSLMNDSIDWNYIKGEVLKNIINSLQI